MNSFLPLDRAPQKDYCGLNSSYHPEHHSEEDISRDARHPSKRRPTNHLKQSRSHNRYKGVRKDEF